MTIEESLRTASCDCGDSWPGLETIYRGHNKVVWLGQNTTYYAMVPGQSLVSKGPGHFVDIQIFFICKLKYRRTCAPDKCTD